MKFAVLQHLKNNSKDSHQLVKNMKTLSFDHLYFLYTFYEKRQQLIPNILLTFTTYNMPQKEFCKKWSTVKSLNKEHLYNRNIKENIHVRFTFQFHTYFKV